MNRIVATLLALLIALTPAYTLAAPAAPDKPELAPPRSGSTSVELPVQAFGRYGDVILRARALEPSSRVLLSQELQILARNSRSLLRTIRLDLVQFNGDLGEAGFNVTIDGRTTFVRADLQTGRVKEAIGPDSLLFATNETSSIPGTIKAEALSGCELAAVYSCASQGLLWGMVNPLAGAVAGAACGILWAASDACG